MMAMMPTGMAMAESRSLGRVNSLFRLRGSEHVVSCVVVGYGLIMHLHVCWVRVGNVIAIACALECLWLGRQSVPELSYT